MMKWVVFVLAVLVGLWLIKRQQTRVQNPGRQARTRELAQPKPMLACAHCGMHFPHDEAITGQHGAYCSAAHRQAAETPAAP